MARIKGVKPIGQQTEYSCGVGSLETIFNFYGYKIGDNLKYINKEGTSHAQLAMIAIKNGFFTHRVEGSVDAVRMWVDSGTPVLVNYQDYGGGHYAVAIGAEGGDLVLADPAEKGKIKTVPIKEFEKRWHDSEAPPGEDKKYALVVLPLKEATKFLEEQE